MNFSKVFITFMLSGTLVACGGGGSSTSPTSTSIATSAYGGSRTAAKVTANNAKGFADTIFQTTNANTTAGGLTALRPTELSLGENVSQARQKLTALVMEKAQNTRYQARAISNAEACSGGGNITASGNIDDTTQTGSARVIFNQCNIEGVVINGTFDVTVSAYNTTYGEPTSAKVTYNGVTITAGGESAIMTGTVSLSTNPATKTGTFATFLYIKASTGEEALADITVNATENADLSTSTNISGNVCAGSEGCVNISTTTPLKFDAYNKPMAGKIMLSGTDNSKAQIVVISYGVVQVSVDANGDGIYEEQQLLN
jgi:hypothetical protein